MRASRSPRSRPTTLDQARAAAKLVDVDYEPLPAILTVEEALAREHYVAPPQTHRARRCRRRRSPARRIGSPASCAAAARIISISKARSRSPRRATTATCMVLSSTQHPTEVQHGVAHLLGLPFNAVTAEVRRMGGAFGGKESQATIIAGIAALLAWKTRPAGEAAAAARRRHARDRQAPSVPDPLRGRLRRRGPHPRARPDARRQRRQRRRPHAGGASRARSAMPTTATGCRTCACAGCPARPTRCRTPPSAASAARRACWRSRPSSRRSRAVCGCRSTTVRRAQFLRHRPQRRDALRHDGRGQHHRARGRRARTHRRPRRAGAPTSMPSTATSPVVKKGLATMPVKFGISFNRPTLNQAGALVHVYTDGSVLLNHGGTEMGQGLFVKVAQVVAEDVQHRHRPHPRRRRPRPARCRTPRRPRPPPAPTSTAWRRSTRRARSRRA